MIGRYWQLYLMVLPPIVTTFIWHYIPLYGVLIAFKDFDSNLGILHSPWYGLYHFRWFFERPSFWDILWNTIRISLYSFATFPCSIIFALMINELTSKKFKKTVQMISYMPHFISTVVVCSMVHMFFNASTGIVNKAIVALGGEAIEFLYRTDTFDHLYIWSGVWQGLGWGTDRRRDKVEHSRPCQYPDYPADHSHPADTPCRRYTGRRLREGLPAADPAQHKRVTRYLDIRLRAYARRRRQHDILGYFFGYWSVQLRRQPDTDHHDEYFRAPRLRRDAVVRRCVI